MSDIIVGKQPVDFDADDYNRYVKYFLDTEVGGIVFNLTKDERRQFL
jgi:hypothetical protein